MRASTLIILLSIAMQPAFCQQLSFEEKLHLQDSLAQKYPREKIFIHQDKPQYKTGDIMWLKGYLLTAAAHLPSDSSGIVYIELINAENEIVKRTAAYVFGGRFSGSLVLYKEAFKQGVYVLRAYTQWMRNFGDSLFYEKNITIIQPEGKDWVAEIRKIDYQNSRLLLSALLKNTDFLSSENRQVEVKLLAGNRSVFSMRTAFDTSGNLYIDTTIKSIQTSKDVYVQISGKNNLEIKVPVRNTRKIDLQFLSEGGTLLAEKTQTLGFKAINIYGKAVAVNGVIKNSSGITITTFSSLRNGMGKVSLKPLAGESYTAVLADGTSFELPKPQSSATILKVLNNPQSDSITLKIDASSNLYNRQYYFTASTRGTTNAFGQLNLTNATSVNLAKSMFPSGVVRFTLYNQQYQPLNERAVFIKHDDDLKLYIKPHKDQFRRKDSVWLQINIPRSNGTTQVGSYSIAVLDTSQVKMTSRNENIASYMLLSSDLKGNIEEPYHYLKYPYSEETDALMLTQGWVNYEWQMPATIFDYEKQMQITGLVKNGFNKVLENTGVTLFGRVGRNNMFLLNTATNKNGQFVFNNFPYFFNDTVSTVIKALNKKGKAFNIGIEVQEPAYPQYEKEPLSSSSENILFDTLAKKFVNGQLHMREQMKHDKSFLEEVVVSAKSRIPGSKNLNPDGVSDRVIGEETLFKTPKMSLLDLLRKEIPGITAYRDIPLKIGSDFVEIILDGVSPKELELNEFDILEFYKAEDIKAIELLISTRNNIRYQKKFLDPSLVMQKDYTYIEITTRTGYWPFKKNIPAAYAYKPVVPVISKQFYSPRYQTPDVQTVFPDMRATVYWNPEITVNEKGEASVSFYTSESNSSYLIILQGTDLNGRFGVQQQYLNIEQKSPK